MNALRVFLLATLLIASVCEASDSAPKALRDKLKSLAGADSQDCGTVLLDESPDAAIACAEDAGASGRAYRLAIEFQGPDAAGWQGAVRDAKGKFWAVYFDSDPSAKEGSGNTLSVVPCREIHFATKGDDVIQCKPPFGER